MSRWYILDDAGNPKPVSALVWARWYDGSLRERVAARDVRGDAMIWTEFRGLNQQMDPAGPPLLYETIICDRNGSRNLLYATREEASRGHAAAVAAASRPHHIKASDVADLRIEGNTFYDGTKR